jgi:hypothetical protein
MVRYSLYGLTVASDAPFPELAGCEVHSASASPDVAVRLRRPHMAAPASAEFVARSTLATGVPWMNCARIENGYLLRFVDYADFIVDRAGSSIECSGSSQNVELVTIRHLVLDQVFPYVLNLRGLEAIHATAVELNGGAVAFSGPAGAGKSTLAASFFAAGLNALGDDCLTLKFDGSVRVIPAYPGIRLWTDSARALAIDGSNAAATSEYSTKRRMLGGQHRARFSSGPVELRVIYLLSRPGEDEPTLSDVVIEDLAAADAFIELVSASFPLDVEDREMLARHFSFMQTVAARVPVRRLRIPNDFAALPKVREAILADSARR